MVLIVPGQLFKIKDKKYLYIARNGRKRLCFDCLKRSYTVFDKDDFLEAEIIKFMEQKTWVLYKPNLFFMVSPIEEYVSKFNDFKNKKNILAVFKANNIADAMDFKRYYFDDVPTNQRRIKDD